MNTIEKRIISKFPISNMTIIYDGIRGDDLSSSNSYIWSRFIRSGIKRIIGLNLKEDPNTIPIKVDCLELGVDYYNFPVGKDGLNLLKNIEKLVEIFKILDKGNFYISCNNVFLIDIVLSCYWMFNVADKGYEPPIIYEFRNKPGAKDNLTFLMRFLDSLYKEFKGVKWNSSLTNEIFQSRKNLIALQFSKSSNELSIEEKRNIIDKVQKRIDELIGREFKIKDAKWLIENGYPFLIWDVVGIAPISFRRSDLLKVHIVYEDLYHLIESKDAMAEEDKLFNYAIEKYLLEFIPQNNK